MQHISPGNMAQTMLLRFFWTIYNMKTFFSFFVIVSLLLAGVQPISYADTTEPWEEELISVSYTPLTLPTPPYV